MDYSKITDNLYIGRTPKKKDFSLLHQLGIGLVINMRIGFPPVRDPNSPSIRTLWLPSIDSPIIPIPIRMLLTGASEALPVVQEGGVVYVHCSKGRHRGPAMGACILIAQGLMPEQAMQLIKQHRPAANPETWYIRRRIMKFAQVWAQAR